MAVELNEVKEYLRLDDDLTEDDVLVSSLIAAAIAYIEQMTGKVFLSTSDLMCVAVKEMVALWYENRITFTTKTNVNELPHSLQSLISHISLCADYAAKE